MAEIQDVSPRQSRELAQRAVTELSGVGPRIAERLKVIGISSVQDVLFHLPFRYQDRTRVRSIASLRAGEEAVIEVEILAADVVIRKRRSLICTVTDGSGLLVLRFFHFNKAQVNSLSVGARLRCFSEVRHGPKSIEMVHPEYTVLHDEQHDTLEDSLTPVYPTTEGVHQLTLRKLTDQALVLLKETDSLKDWLHHIQDDTFGFPSLTKALRTAHRPGVNENIAALMDGTHPAHQRLAFEELVAHRLGLRKIRQQMQQIGALPVDPPRILLNQFLTSLPFSLTQAQARVLAEVASDLGLPQAMLRLVQGDVGSGKTVVAAAAAALAVEAGMQVAIMAPTEILAEQHMLNFSAWFSELDVAVGWLSGKMTARNRQSELAAIAGGQSQIVVGTHALFQREVEFANLGLVIIDEQHRFGVDQRMALRNKGAITSGDGNVDQTLLPHQLIMTATPIPRTLAMTAYADLEISVIDELPPGRKPVRTVAVESARRQEIVERISSALAKGRQVYWVCTLIEESELLQCEAAENTAEALQQALPDYRVGLIHGRLKSTEKDRLMSAFKDQQLDLLVATTVIEVGVDVPNASLMVIENAERLGLSQLHQLRGRVGRGAIESTCILIYQAPLSRNARERIAIMRETNDGFLIAQKDLHLRGAGELLGTRQTGLVGYRIADLGRDTPMLTQVAQVSDAIIDRVPEAADALIRRWIGEKKPGYGAV